MLVFTLTLSRAAFAASDADADGCVAAGAPDAWGAGWGSRRRAGI